MSYTCLEHKTLQAKLLYREWIKNELLLYSVGASLIAHQ